MVKKLCSRDSKKRRKKKKEMGIEVWPLDAGAFRRTAQRARSGLLLHFALNHCTMGKLVKFLCLKVTDLIYIVQILIEHDFGDK